MEGAKHTWREEILQCFVQIYRLDISNGLELLAVVKLERRFQVVRAEAEVEF